MPHLLPPSPCPVSSPSFSSSAFLTHLPSALAGGWLGTEFRLCPRRGQLDGYCTLVAPNRGERARVLRS